MKTEKSCANNSAIKLLKIFKKIIRIALLNDWLQKDPFASIKFRQDEVHVEFLTMYVLLNLIEKPMPCKRPEQIRDVFVIFCFTRLAFVDIKGLHLEHVMEKCGFANIPLLRIPNFGYIG